MWINSCKMVELLYKLDRWSCPRRWETHQLSETETANKKKKPEIIKRTRGESMMFSSSLIFSGVKGMYFVSFELIFKKKRKNKIHPKQKRSQIS